jgi:hypothetical protein
MTTGATACFPLDPAVQVDPNRVSLTTRGASTSIDVPAVVVTRTVFTGCGGAVNSVSGWLVVWKLVQAGR